MFIEAIDVNTTEETMIIFGFQDNLDEFLPFIFRLEEIGVEIHLNTPVTKELLEEQRVTTMVDFDKVVMDLGEVLIGTETNMNFYLINKGSNLLVVDDIKTSCGCTRIEYSQKPVAPNDSLKIRVSVKAEEIGLFNKVITVHCNDKQSPFRLRIKGLVK